MRTRLFHLHMAGCFKTSQRATYHWRGKANSGDALVSLHVWHNLYFSPWICKVSMPGTRAKSSVFYIVRRVAP